MPIALVSRTLGLAKTVEMARKAYYAVANGRESGVYSDWDECKSRVNGYSGAVYKKFDSAAEAQSFVSRNQGATSYRDVSYGSLGGSSSRSGGSSGGYSGGYSGGSSYDNRGHDSDGSYDSHREGNRGYSPFCESYSARPDRSYEPGQFGGNYNERFQSRDSLGSAHSSSSGFGSSSAKPYSSSGFGSSSAKPYSSSGFGSSSAKPYSSSGFGSSSTKPYSSSGFGSSSAKPYSSSGFGSSSAKPYSSSGFGSSSAKPYSTKAAPKAYYGAIFKDSENKIFDNWTECSSNIKGVRGVSYKKFNTYEEAANFVSEKGGNSVIEHDFGDLRYSATKAPNASSKVNHIKSAKPQEVYCDGSLIQGKSGFGVYFGENSSKNASKAVNVDSSSSFASELYAIKYTSEVILDEIDDFLAKKRDSVPKYKVISDSESVLNVMNNYASTWTKDDFLKRPNGDVMYKVYHDVKKIESFYKENSDLFDNHKFELQWIKGHDGFAGNEEADKLAKNGALNGELYK